MRRSIKRRFMVMLVFAVMINVLSGCGHNGKEEKRSDEEILDITYEATELSLEGIQGEICSSLVVKDHVFLHTVESQSDREGKEVFRYYTANLDGSNVKEIAFNLPDHTYFVSMSVGENGKMIGLIAPQESETKQEDMDLAIFDMDGKELTRKGIEQLQIKQDILTGRIFFAGEDNILLVGNSDIYILNQELNLKNTVKIDDGWQIADIALAKNGQIVCVESEQNSSMLSTKTRVLDIETGKWGEEIKIDWNGYLGNDYIMNGVDADIYYKSVSGIYSYDLASKESKKLLDFEASYVTLEEGQQIQSVGDGKFLGFVHEETNEGNNGLLIYTKVDPSELESRQTIVYGCMSLQDTVKNQIAEFNKKNKEYKIEVKEYYQEEGQLDKLSAEIIAGKGPDIFDLSDLPVDQYVELGLLEDLTPYIEKDSELKADDIVTSVAEAMKINGRFYYLSPDFGVNTLVAGKKDVGDQDGWTFEEMEAALEKKGNQADLLDGERDMLKIEILFTLLDVGYMDFVDREKGECSFNSKEFKDILAYCNKRGLDKQKKMSDSEWQEHAQEQASRIREGKVLLKEGTDFSAQQIQVDKSLFGGDVTYIGYPNAERQGSYFTFRNPIGISAQSQVKEKAWEFVRTFLLREYQGKQLMNDSIIPTRQDCFDMQMQAAMTTEPYTDEFGNEVEPLNSNWFWGSVELKQEPVTEKDMEQFLELIQNTKKVQKTDDNISSIIEEEAQHYFEGDRKLEETVEVIQNRVTTYINEQN